ncbi:hypothetical protein EZV62_003295 [Acer yangbiense]|uniref:DUF4220 domain-containing protein n=1 Tax=Acer yangbiense TaxID=1000413 RepID=A0A5C7IGB0_9ROSI|nr:hypothetical protein EZV62_003295 [Acer yangbiense]
MAQYNLISSCLRNVQSICNGIHSLPWIGELVDKYHCLTRKDVDVDLQDIIFKQLQQKSNEIEDARFSISCKKLLAHRGDHVLEKWYNILPLEKRYNLPDISGWSINDVDFDHSLLLWHIATDLCYASDGNDNTVVPKMAECRISKYLSDYMLYLLVFCPSMLQEGIAEIRYRDTFAECKRFFPEEKIRYWKFVLKRKQSIEKTEACKKLLGVKFGDEQEHIKGDQSQSVLFYGCRLAKQLQDLETQAGWTRKQKLEMISEVWVEMLTYAANKCIWKEHGQQLRRGGELLTHVRLLMVHLGLSEQYRIQKQFISEKLDRNFQCCSWLRAPYNILCRLLLGAVLLEINAFLLLIFSDWTKLWLIKLKKETSKTLVEHFWGFIGDSAPLLTTCKRWSRSIGDVSKLNPKCKVSKYLSDYMLYLLVFCPYMLPQGFGLIRYKEGFAEAISIFKKKRPDDILNESKACKDLLEKQFQDMTDIHRRRKWEVISDVWVEMLAFAAHNCGWKEYVQQLRKDGELLTHVYLLWHILAFVENIPVIHQPLKDSGRLRSLMRYLDFQTRIASKVLGCIFFSRKEEEYHAAFSGETHKNSEWVGSSSAGSRQPYSTKHPHHIQFSSKFTASHKVRIPVWSAYLIADSVASIALGNLATSKADCDDKLSESGNALQAFWAPFLLLHLGGPDTVTAYSLEDNELWLRHFLGLVLQTGLAFYVFLRSWSNNALTFIAIPMFITGIIKYGERTFVLRSSSADFKESMLSSTLLDLPQECINPASSYVLQAYFFISAEDAFKLIEAELGFMYDVLYTKATIVYSRFGIFFRCISFFSSVSALIIFSTIIDIHAYPIADISLTYLLLVAAVFLEIYALILFLLSDWTKIWLIIKIKTSEYNPTLRKLLHLLSRVFSYFHSATVIDSPNRWSRSMAQHNLISYSLKDMSATRIVDFISKRLGINYWGISFETRYKDTCKEIKSAILKSKVESELASVCKVLLPYEKDDQREGEVDMSVLHLGCRLAKELQSNKVKWKTISEVWIDMLTHAANSCAWKEHEQQLTNGSELLTHVSLLMAHLGLSEQYQKKKNMKPI